MTMTMETSARRARVMDGLFNAAAEYVAVAGEDDRVSPIQLTGLMASCIMAAARNPGWAVELMAIWEAQLRDAGKNEDAIAVFRRYPDMLAAMITWEAD